jgi:aspartate 1-decarboxylase
MLIHVLKSKVHRVKVTQAELYYVGSLTLDRDLMDAAGMYPHEKIQVVNVNNGSRFETYLIEGERGSGVVCLNGPTARLAAVGDVVIIMSYALIDQAQASTHQPVVIFPDDNNKLLC